MTADKLKKIKKILKDERGVSLVESLVAVAILGGVVLMIIMGMGSGMVAVGETGQETTAQGLARTQLEYIKEYPYNASATTYPAVSAPDGYSIIVSVSAVPGATDSIQKITAEILRGEESIITVEDYKVDR